MYSNHTHDWFNLMFILITPIHNELSEIDSLATTVLSSSFLPDQWIILDDCSDDGSSEKLQTWAKLNDIIKIVYLDKKSEYMEFHISEVFQAGVKVIQDKLKEIKYIGFLDADIRFSVDYWSRCRDYLDQNPNIGIVSGLLCSKGKHSVWKIEPFQRIDNPRGGLRLVKGACFNDIGGVQRSRTWDAIMNVQARLKNWDLRVLEGLIVLSTRPTDNKYGKQAGEFSRGKREWHLHQQLWMVMVRAFFKLLRGNFTSAYFYIKGYWHEFRSKGEQFPDPNVRRYYRVGRPHEWFYSIQCKILGKDDPYRIIPSQSISLKDHLTDENLRQMLT